MALVEIAPTLPQTGLRWRFGEFTSARCALHVKLGLLGFVRAHIPVTPFYGINSAAKLRQFRWRLHRATTRIVNGSGVLRSKKVAV
jgi:hypothetical protein